MIWKMKTGQIPYGNIQYVGNTFIRMEKPDNSDAWAKDPGGMVYHKPSCEFRLNNWDDYTKCRCYSAIPRRIYKAKPALKTETEEEIPF